MKNHLIVDKQHCYNNNSSRLALYHSNIYIIIRHYYWTISKEAFFFRLKSRNELPVTTEMVHNVDFTANIFNVVTLDESARGD